MNPDPVPAGPTLPAPAAGAGSPDERAATGSHVFVIQQATPRFQLLPYSVALSWRQEYGTDLALYTMYESVELLRASSLARNDELRELVDGLVQAGVPIFTCGFCTRACELTADDYYPGVVVANRTILHDLLSSRTPLYW